MKVKMGDVVAAGPAPRQSCIISLGCMFLASALVTACASASAEGQQQPAGLSIAGPQVAAQEADVPQRNADFALWLDELRREAEAEGISPSTFRAAFAGVTPIARVIELDRRQPEFTQTFWRYFQNAISEERVQRGPGQ